MKNPILIAACGNPDAEDGAFGVLVAERVARSFQEGADCVILGTDPAALIDHLPGRAGLLLVDALRAPHVARGTVLDARWSDPARPALVHGEAPGSHGLSLDRQLELARELGVLPDRVRLVGAATGDGERSLGVDVALRAAVRPAAERVVEHARSWLAAALAY